MAETPTAAVARWWNALIGTSLSGTEKTNARADIEAAKDTVITDHLTPGTALTSSTSITPDIDVNGYSMTLTLAHDTTLGLPANLDDGGSCSISAVQDATGGRAVSLNASYVIMNGALTDISGLAANKAFELAIKRAGSAYRIWITVEQ